MDEINQIQCYQVNCVLTLISGLSFHVAWQSYAIKTTKVRTTIFMFSLPFPVTSGI